MDSVFIEEAGFNINISHNRGWPKKDAPTKAVVSSTRSTSLLFYVLFRLTYDLETNFTNN